EAVVLRPADTQALKRDVAPNREQEKEILRRSVRVQSRWWVGHFQKEAIPEGWKESPVLRHHRLAVFTEGDHAAEGRVIRLHDKLGLITSVQVLHALSDNEHPH